MLKVWSFSIADRSPARYEGLTMGTLNFAGPDSINRQILTYEIGDAPWHGKKLKKNVPLGMVGMVFCNPDGDEVGGRGWIDNNASSFAISAFDYADIPSNILHPITITCLKKV